MSEFLRPGIAFNHFTSVIEEKSQKVSPGLVRKLPKLPSLASDYYFMENVTSKIFFQTVCKLSTALSDAVG